jgi:hypothetical protein
VNGCYSSLRKRRPRHPQILHSLSLGPARNASNSFSSQTAHATQCGDFLNNQGARSQAVRSVAHPR